MLAVPNICAKVCNPVAMAFFFWRQNDKSREISLIFAFTSVQPQP